MNSRLYSSASDTKTEVEQLTARLNEKLAALRTSDGYRDYLRMQSRFPHYSLSNCLLILSQKPDAQHVAGYTVWSSLGRHVNAGEHGIRIMAPRTYKRPVPAESSSEDPAEQPAPAQQVHLYFRPISVFDISQTSGDPLPTLAVDELQGRVDGYAILRDSLMEASPVPVRFESVTSGAKGYYSPAAGEIVINVGMSEQQTLKTLAHEIGHAIAHSPDSPGVNEKNRSAKETEAESIAFIVCSHYGINTDEYSFPYIGSWSSDMDDRQLSAQITGIKGTAVSIIDKTDACIQRHLSESHTKISYRIPEGYLSVRKDSEDGSVCYRFYDTDFHETKSGESQLPPQMSIRHAAEQVLINHGMDPQDKQDFSPEQLQEHVLHSRQSVVHRMH